MPSGCGPIITKPSQYPKRNPSLAIQTPPKTPSLQDPKSLDNNKNNVLSSPGYKNATMWGLQIMTSSPSRPKPTTPIFQQLFTHVFVLLQSSLLVSGSRCNAA